MYQHALDWGSHVHFHNRRIGCFVFSFITIITVGLCSLRICNAINRMSRVASSCLNIAMAHSLDSPSFIQGELGELGKSERQIKSPKISWKFIRKLLSNYQSIILIELNYYCNSTIFSGIFVANWIVFVDFRSMVAMCAIVIWTMLSHFVRLLIASQLEFEWTEFSSHFFRLLFRSLQLSSLEISISPNHKVPFVRQLRIVKLLRKAIQQQSHLRFNNWMLFTRNNHR